MRSPIGEESDPDRAAQLAEPDETRWHDLLHNARGPDLQVRVSLRNDEKLKAFVSITLNHAFVIRGLKIIRGNTGLFVAMPSRKRPDGQHQDLAHPINDATRKYLTQKVMAEYERELANPTHQPGAAKENY